jgi:hypothetical protein
MRKTFLYGLSVAVFSFAATFSTDATAFPGYACTAANDGEITATERYTVNGGYVQTIWECIAGSGWSRIARCDSNGCIYY